MRLVVQRREVRDRYWVHMRSPTTHIWAERVPVPTPALWAVDRKRGHRTKGGGRRRQANPPPRSRSLGQRRLPHLHTTRAASRTRDRHRDRRIGPEQKSAARTSTGHHPPTRSASVRAVAGFWVTINRPCCSTRVARLGFLFWLYSILNQSAANATSQRIHSRNAKRAAFGSS